LSVACQSFEEKKKLIIKKTIEHFSTNMDPNNKTLLLFKEFLKG
jgi:hypothetical protein